MTHYVPAYAPISGVRERAICGTYVFSRDHALKPTCPSCVELVAEDEAREAEDAAALAALQEMPPSPQPTLSTFDILDGYTLRSRR